VIGGTVLNYDGKITHKIRRRWNRYSHYADVTPLKGLGPNEPDIACEITDTLIKKKEECPKYIHNVHITYFPFCIPQYRLYTFTDFSFSLCSGSFRSIHLLFGTPRTGLLVLSGVVTDGQVVGLPLTVESQGWQNK
jgi:hypothetical protein